MDGECEAIKSSNFVEEEGDGSFVEEDVVLGFVADEGGEVLADDAVPVGPVFFIELIFDMLGHFALDFDIIYRPSGLYSMKLTSFMASLVMSEFSAMSMMLVLLFDINQCLNYITYQITKNACHFYGHCHPRFDRQGYQDPSRALSQLSLWREIN